MSGSRGHQGEEGGSVAAFGGDIVVSGSLYVSPEDDTKGLVLISPNGTKFKLDVANDGVLGTTAV